MSLVRLQKFLAECGVASRRKAEELIELGDVTVNGAVVTKLGTKINPDKDAIKVSGKLVRVARKGVLLFHKPKHVVSTMSDPEGRETIADHLGERYRAYFPVGRLDFESTGLVVITNDGELADCLMHPRYGFERIYQVKVNGQVTQDTIKKLAAGVRLADGRAKARAKILRTGPGTTWLEISVTEGRNRLVRRLMDKIRHPVIKLTRVAHGPFHLGQLAPGEMRLLKDENYQQFRKIVFTRAKKSE